MAVQAAPPAKQTYSKPDIATFAGLLLAGGGILGGLIIDGGKLTDIAQVTALMIVLGGTLGAVMVTTPLKTLIKAGKCLGSVFMEHRADPGQAIGETTGYATQARKNSNISVDADLPNTPTRHLPKPAPCTRAAP